MYSLIFKHCYRSYIYLIPFSIIQAWCVPDTKLLERRGAHGHPTPYPSQRQLHLPVRRRRAGRHPVVARSRRLPPGNHLWRSHHPTSARRRLLSVSQASQGGAHSHRFVCHDRTRIHMLNNIIDQQAYELDDLLKIYVSTYIFSSV